MADEITIARMFELFEEMWPNREVTPSMVHIYNLVLEDIPDDDLMSAAINCIETCKFFPVPAEIRERTNSETTLSGEAALVLAMGDKNFSELPEIVKRTLKNIGGRPVLTEGNFGYARRDFLAAYAEFSKEESRERSRERSQKLLPKLNETIKLIEGSK